MIDKTRRHRIAGKQKHGILAATRVVKEGEQCGRWTVIGREFFVRVKGQRRRYVVCSCECGVVAAILVSHL